MLSSEGQHSAKKDPLHQKVVVFLEVLFSFHGKTVSYHSWNNDWAEIQTMLSQFMLW